MNNIVATNNASISTKNIVLIDSQIEDLQTTKSTVELAFNLEVLEQYRGILAKDYGDAPDPNPNTTTGDYQTKASDSGASHEIIPGLKIGNNIDADDGTLENTTATADDNSSVDDDEDGVTFGSNLEADDTTYSLDVNLTNDTNLAATLVGWIDFDRNGSFDADEAVSKTIAANSGNTDVVLTWDDNASNNGDGNGDLPGTGALTGDAIETGATYARFRLSTDNSLVTVNNSDSVGDLPDGEVEDYQFNIGSPVADSELTTPNLVYIGEQDVELTLTFDNTGAIPGYGPFALLYVDNTGVDGAGSEIDDGLTFKGAKFLGADVIQTEYTF
ncbi:MAG: GEVED domain-containing protein, partial [Pleurocapsa sp.]